MLGRVVSWLNKRLEGAPVDSPEAIMNLMANRSNLEIAARMIHRSQLHSDDNLPYYIRRCAPLDQIAGNRIVNLEKRIAELEGRDPSKIDVKVTNMLEQLRKP